MGHGTQPAKDILKRKTPPNLRIYMRAKPLHAHSIVLF